MSETKKVCPRCRSSNLAWLPYLTIYESFEFQQCMNCGKILGRRNYAEGLKRKI
jgi:phage FluMu protein Com